MNYFGILWSLLFVPAIVQAENFFDYFDALKVLFGYDLPILKVVNTRVSIGVNKVNLRFILNCNDVLNCTQLNGQFVASIVPNEPEKNEEVMATADGTYYADQSYPTVRPELLYPAKHVGEHKHMHETPISQIAQAVHNANVRSSGDLKIPRLGENTLTDDEVETLLEVVTDDDIMEILKKKHAIRDVNSIQQDGYSVYSNGNEEARRGIPNSDEHPEETKQPDVIKQEDTDKHLEMQHPLALQLHQMLKHLPETEHVDMHLKNPDIIDVFKNYQLLQQQAQQNTN